MACLGHPSKHVYMQRDPSEPVRRPERLAVLGETNLLDTPAEEAFDRVARLASRFLNAPVAQINLIDQSRQFSKSSIGPGSWSGPRSVPLDLSYCKHVVTSDTPLVIEDARQHPLVRENHATTESGIVAYAAVPLNTAEGHTLGTLCAVDFAPRSWSHEDLQTLSDLAETVMTEIRLRRDLRLRQQSEARLRESEERFREMANRAPVLLWLAGPDGRRSFFNEQWLDFTGRTMEQELGEGWIEGVHPDDKLEYLVRYQAALAAREEFRIEYRLRSASGEYRWVLVHGAPRLTPGNEALLGYVGSAVDVTEQKRAEALLRSSHDDLQVQIGRHTSELTQVEAAERRVRTILESITDAFFAIDNQGRFTIVNRRAEEAFGKSRQELLGRNLWELFPASVDRQFYPQYHRAMAEQVAVVFEEYSPPSDRWVQVHAYPHGEGLAIYMRDITARKNAEAALQRAKEEAETANRAKSEFLSRMSHELRTPMNAILGFAQLLELELEDRENRESVQQILRGGRHLLSLIDEVLDIARIEAGRMTLSAEPVHVGRLVEESLSLVHPLAAQRHVQLPRKIPDVCDRHVLADQQRLKQVLLNLWSNAIKYNHEGGLVGISCESVEERLRITVSDTGQGMAPEKLSRLFTPFDRLGAEQSETQGTGLGLALSKALVEAMGGSIGVESVPDRGSRFWVELPLTEGPLERYEREELREGSPPERISYRRRRILYIEDNLSNLRLVERIFARQQDLEIIPAMQGRLGIELAAKHRPDLILLDVHLPDIMGDEVLAELQRTPELREIPVVVISADATPKQIKRLMGGGAREYLTKPFEVVRLRAVVDEALGRSDAQE